MTSARPDAPHVAVALCTYRRPELLQRLLISLSTLSYPSEALSVVVIDHDLEKSAEQVAAAARSKFLDFRYEVEPVRLISAARNRLAATALQTPAEFVAFVDDDEWVPRDWLTTLVSAAERYEADAIAGRVVPVYEEGVPPWVVEGRFFDRVAFQTGDEVRGHGIGNVLVRRHWLEQLAPPFGTRFRTPGGEDVHFLMNLERAGARTYWCNEGHLFEWVPVERANRLWIIRRSFHMSSAFSECLRSANTPTFGLMIRTAKCFIRLVQGLVECAVAPIRGPMALTAACVRISAACGGMHGLAIRPSQHVVEERQ